VARTSNAPTVRAREKIRGRRALRQLVAREHRKGHTVVFTSGCYDLLHVGHLRSFEAARALGDLLVVGVNRDKRVGELKGARHPIVPERQRAEMVAGLSCVDWVVLFGEDDAGPLIRAIAPDVVCKGGEYRGRRIPEQEAVEAGGGRFVHLRQIPGVRSSLIVERVRSRS
jgi:rfaE bifunctional protein nucleotidyltransferase chain/domain